MKYLFSLSLIFLLYKIFLSYFNKNIIDIEETLRSHLKVYVLNTQFEINAVRNTKILSTSANRFHSSFICRFVDKTLIIVFFALNFFSRMKAFFSFQKSFHIICASDVCVSLLTNFHLLLLRDLNLFRLNGGFLVFSFFFRSALTKCFSCCVLKGEQLRES